MFGISILVILAPKKAKTPNFKIRKIVIGFVQHLNHLNHWDRLVLGLGYQFWSFQKCISWVSTGIQEKSRNLGPLAL